MILWDLEKKTALKTVPTFECIESLVGVPLNRTLPDLKIKEEESPHIITAGDRGCLRVWNLKASKEIFSQTNSLVSASTLEGAPSITQLHYSSSDDTIYMVTFDHNIIVHKVSDFAPVKQYAGYNDDVLDVVWYGEGETHLAVATNSNHVKVCFSILKFASFIYQNGYFRFTRLKP